MAAEFKVAATAVGNDSGGLSILDSGLVYSFSPVGAKIRTSLQKSEHGLNSDALLENLNRQFDASPRRLTKGRMQAH